MNTIRTIVTVLPVMLLIACGGGGGGGAAAIAPTAPLPTDDGGENWSLLTRFEPTPGLTPTPDPDSSSIEAVRAIGRMEGANLSLGRLAEAGNFGSEMPAMRINNLAYHIALPGNGNTMSLNVTLDDLSLSESSGFWLDREFTSVTTNGVTVDDVTLARGRLAGTRYGGMTPMEFQTFSGWLDGSFFGTVQMAIGASGSEQYRFISYSVGVPSGSDPGARESETSATWEGVAVASMKAITTFIRGDAAITIPDLANPDVDVTLDNWRSLDDQVIPNLSAISYTDLTLTNGGFEGSGNEQVFGRFYGTDHNEVGGHFNTMDVIGAFGGTRQPVQPPQ